MKKLLAILLLLALLTGCSAETTAPTQPTQPTQPPATQTGTEELLYVHFIDVGQADCTLLKLGDLEILIDGGNTEDGSYIYNYLCGIGVDDIELMIATHAHEDHYGGLGYILRKVETEAVWVTHDPYAYSYYGTFLDAADTYGPGTYTPEVGEIFSQDGLTLTVLGPVKDYSADNTNNTSLVVMVRYGDVKFLLTGDMERDAEAELLASGADLSADVLKVGHHGSYTSSSAAFLKAVGADFGIIHVGRDNEYGHPHDDSMKRLLSAGMTLYRTDLCRDLAVATDGKTLAFLFTDAGGITQEKEDLDLPPDGTALTIAEAIEICQKTGQSSTWENYCITGTVTQITSAVYGNMYITDETGTIFVYGVYGPGGDTPFNALENPPNVGDTVTLYGCLVNYRDEIPEMKNAWIIP